MVCVLTAGKDKGQQGSRRTTDNSHKEGRYTTTWKRHSVASQFWKTTSCLGLCQHSSGCPFVCWVTHSHTHTRRDNGEEGGISRQWPHLFCCPLCIANHICGHWDKISRGQRVCYAVSRRCSAAANVWRSRPFDLPTVVFQILTDVVNAVFDFNRCCYAWHDCLQAEAVNICQHLILVW